MIKKAYKTEAREIKKKALSARLTFRQRKVFLNIQPYLTGLFFMALNGFLVIEGFETNYPIFAWFVLCLMSIPMYITIYLMFGFLPKFTTLEEYIEYSLKSYLKDFSWRSISVILKKHKFPKIIESILLKILLLKISKMAKKKEIIESLEGFGHIKYVEKENLLVMVLQQKEETLPQKKEKKKWKKK